MTRVIELLYVRKIVNVFVAHDARRVGDMKKRETPMTRTYKITEVTHMFQESASKDSSNNVNVCGGNAGVMFGRKLACVQ